MISHRYIVAQLERFDSARKDANLLKTLQAVFGLNVNNVLVLFRVSSGATVVSQ
jgi:hypothetical protein